jgi:hypothetical protein
MEEELLNMTLNPERKSTSMHKIDMHSVSPSRSYWLDQSIYLYKSRSNDLSICPVHAFHPPSSSKVTLPPSKAYNMGLYLLDYGAGNVQSLANSLTKLGHKFRWITQPSDFAKATVRTSSRK